VTSVWTLVIHGGSGSITRDTLTPTEEEGARAGLTAALEAGAALLRAGGEPRIAVYFDE